MNREEFADLLKSAWCKETSYEPEKWTQQNPAHGQCAITAPLVQDYFGGEILWCEAFLPDDDIIYGKGIDHYFNQIDDEIIDYTKHQFPKGSIFTKPAHKRKTFSTTRDFILSYPETLRRYNILKNRLQSKAA